MNFEKMVVIALLLCCFLALAGIPTTHSPVLSLRVVQTSSNSKSKPPEIFLKETALFSAVEPLAINHDLQPAACDLQNAPAVEESFFPTEISSSGLLTAYACFESRQGWKTSGNGFFIYEAQTNYGTTNRTLITGVFSTKAASQANNVLLAVEDAAGELIGQVSINKGSLENNVYNSLGYRHGLSRKTAGISLGYDYTFRIIIESELVINANWSNSLLVYVGNEPGLGVELSKKDAPWNFDNITLYIGGYKTPKDGGQFFEGCLSDVMFEGVDIISTYFQQFPNNTNPKRSGLTIGRFSNVAEQCDVVSSTLAPTTTPTSKVPTTTKPNDANICSLNISVVLLLLAFAFATC